MAISVETQKEIRRLKQVEGLTNAEIAKRLNVGLTTVGTYGGPPTKDIYSFPRGKPIKEVIQELKDLGKPTSGSDKELRDRLRFAKYSRSEKGRKTTKKYNQTPRGRANRSEIKKAGRAARREEKKILQSKNPVIITDEAEINKLAREKATNAIKIARERSAYYKINQADDPSSWINYKQLKQLKEQGENPTIYNKAIAGDFSPKARAEMRKTIERQASEYLRKGGDVRNMPEFGHHIALNAIDESGQRVASGLTNQYNIGLQDPYMNRSLRNTVDEEFLQASGKKGSIPKKLLRARGFLPGLLGMATLPLWLMAPDRAQAMVDTGQQNISSTANKYFPQGLMDYARNIGSTVDNYIGQSFPTNTLGGIQANIGQYLFDSLKQVPAETVGIGMALKNIHDKSKNAPERNLSWAERMRLMQSGRSY
jgi:hypothetical protein